MAKAADERRGDVAADRRRQRTGGGGGSTAGETTRVREVRWLATRSSVIFSSGEKVVPACESCVDKAGASRHVTK
jgi:hypothetical protein